MDTICFFQNIHHVEAGVCQHQLNIGIPVDVHELKALLIPDEPHQFGGMIDQPLIVGKPAKLFHRNGEVVRCSLDHVLLSHFFFIQVIQQVSIYICVLKKAVFTHSFHPPPICASMALLSEHQMPYASSQDDRPCNLRSGALPVP